ncbi:Fanconi anemia core complex-associated protein 20 [Tiliqua scincoides]|uniref:Fanconi anemia core complex-associated protein 20 n=1 Tax=Tiliqua scincoides TaxID=71010 RepID=UPI003461CD04
MAEGGERGRAGKLSLKRKRPPGDEPPPRTLQTFASSSPWFEEQDLSDTESAWVALIKAMKPPLTYSNLEKVIKLPEFVEKSSRTADTQPIPEMFYVGTKQFEWVPFPLHHREDTKANDPKRQHDSANERASLIETEENEDERLKYISLVSEQKPPTANECAAEESRMRHSIKQSTKLEIRERNEKWPHANQLDIPGPSTISAVSRFSKKFDFPECSKETTIKGSGKSRRESERKSSNDALVHHATSFEATPALPAQESSSAGFSGQAKLGDDSNATPTLDRCPMCQMRFTGTWSKLDLDSHLAKCLSESTEDVFW